MAALLLFTNGLGKAQGTHTRKILQVSSWFHSQAGVCVGGWEWRLQSFLRGGNGETRDPGRGSEDCWTLT